jgi:hypothetical protein
MTPLGRGTLPVTPSPFAFTGGDAVIDPMAQDIADAYIEAFERAGVRLAEIGNAGLFDPFLKLMDDLAAALEAHIEQTIGDAVFNGFAAAFSGEGFTGALEAFGKTILAGLGALFVELGQQLIAYGIVMSKLMPFLLNIFTSGPAAIAAGVALVALGSAFTSIASGRGGVGRGTATAGAFREPRLPAPEDFTTRQITWGPGTKGLRPMPSIGPFQIFGPADPVAQRAIISAVEQGIARGLGGKLR